ncbi:hypothetical protein P9209_20055 [Prescottella defluvii]|nr:hypothetical protein P9209_20055 [Prescottella defluvii]
MTGIPASSPTSESTSSTASRAATEPLREDIRLLGGILGEIVREQSGDDIFGLVERARVESFRSVGPRSTGLSSPRCSRESTPRTRSR